MSAKYKEYYQRMIEENQSLFDEFTDVHVEYCVDPKAWQVKFNEIGAKILEVIHEWENRLCKTSEKAGYGNYTNNLSEKFWEEIRGHYARIDRVGIIIEEPKPEPEFLIKKIAL